MPLAPEVTPGSDIPWPEVEARVHALQRFVITTAACVDGPREGNQGWLPKRLRYRLLGDGAADSAISVFKWVNGDKVEMRDAGTRQNGQG